MHKRIMSGWCGQVVYSFSLPIYLLLFSFYSWISLSIRSSPCFVVLLFLTSMHSYSHVSKDTQVGASKRTQLLIQVSQKQTKVVFCSKRSDCCACEWMLRGSLCPSVQDLICVSIAIQRRCLLKSRIQNFQFKCCRS